MINVDLRCRIAQILAFNTDNELRTAFINRTMDEDFLAIGLLADRDLIDAERHLIIWHGFHVAVNSIYLGL